MPSSPPFNIDDDLGEAEGAALLGPVDRDISLHQVSQSELSRLCALKDGLSNAGGEIRQPVPPTAALAFDINDGIIDSVAAQFATTRSMVRLATHVATEGRRAFNGAAILGLAERNQALIALGRRHVALLNSLRTLSSDNLRIPTEHIDV